MAWSRILLLRIKLEIKSAYQRNLQCKSEGINSPHVHWIQWNHIQFIIINNNKKKVKSPTKLFVTSKKISMNDLKLFGMYVFAYKTSLFTLCLS